MAGPNWHLADDRKTITDSFPSDPPIALKLESHDTRGLLGKLFGKGSVAALLLAVLLIGGTAWAQYTAFGVGTKSCGSWTEAKEKDPGDRSRFHNWVNGYMTAYSRWVESGVGPVSDETDPEGAWAWVDNYCRDNPLKDVSDAAAELIVEIVIK